jgi:hypothetical protein
LKSADARQRNEILDFIGINHGTVQLPDSLVVSSPTSGSEMVSSELQPPKANHANKPNEDNHCDNTTDEKHITTFISRDEHGVVRIFGATSNLHVESPGINLTESTESQRTAAKPDHYQLIANAALQRQKEHDLRRLESIGGIRSELAMHLLDLHWNRQHHTYHLTYRPAFMRDLAESGPYCSEFLLNAVFGCSSKFSERIEVREDPERPETAGKRFLTVAMH